MHRQQRRVWVRFLSARGIPPGHIAFVLEVDEDLVKRDLAIRKGRRPKRLAFPGRHLHPATSLRRRVLGQLGTKIRRLRELAYEPAVIADILMVEPVAVKDFVARLVPMRRGRVEPDKLTRPREPAADRAARQSEARAEVRRLARLALAPPCGWSHADRIAAAAVEAAEFASFVAAVREGKLSAAELVDQAGVFYAPLRRRPVEVAVPEPAIWTGSTASSAGNPKLDPAMIAEMRVLRAHGWSTGALAERYGVTRATICYALLGRTFKEERPAPPPLPFSGGVPLLLNNS